MNDISFGLKLWSTNYNLIGEAEKLIKDGFFNYIELLIVPDTDILPFQEIKVPYILHITSERQGLNIADKDKEEFNLKTIERCVQWGNELNAKYLILHPGFGEIESAKKFLEKINGERILIENMPKVGLDNEKMIGFTPEQIKELIGDKFGFCLDFNHAIKAVISLKKDYKKYIKDFLKLNPKMFHISDSTLRNQTDGHLNIGEGEYDFNFLAGCIKKSQTGYISIETPRTNLSSLEEDLENLKKLKSFLSDKKSFKKFYFFFFESS